VDDAGNAVVVWVQQDDQSSLSTFLYSSYYTGNVWQTAQKVTDVAVSTYGIPSPYRVAMDPASGRAMLFWLQQVGGGSIELWAKAFDPASGWGTASQLDASPDNSSTISVGLDATGAALVAWSRYANLTSRVFANRYVFGAGWGDPVNIGADNPDWTSKELNVQLAVSPAGDAVATWTTAIYGSPSDHSITSNRFTPGSGWGTVSTVIANDVDPDFTKISDPKIGMDSSGQAIVAWSEWHMSSGVARSQVWTKRYTDGWQDATPVDSPTANGSWLPNPIFAVSTGGSAAVAWVESDMSLKVSVAPAGGAWGDAQTLSATGLLDSQFLPALSMDGAGNIHAAWNRDSSNDDHGLWAGYYSASSGTWTSQPFQDPMASATTGWSPALATNAKGDTVLAWTNFTSDSGSQVVASYQSASP